MRREKVRVTAALAAVMLSIFCMTGCKDQESGSNGSSRTEGDFGEKTERAQAFEKEELEPAELTWLLRISEQPDGQQVMDKVNEILQDRINATLDIQFIDAVAYPEKTKLKISSGEEFDIMFTSLGYGYQDYAARGAYVELENLLETYAPRTWEMIPEEFWDATRVNGHIYGIPNYQIAARQTTLEFRKDLVEKYDLDIDGMRTVEDMEPVLAVLKKNEPDKQFILAPPSLTYFDTMNYLQLEGIGADGTPGCIEMNSSELTVVNQYEHPNFVRLVKTLKRYEEAGYINKDLALVKDGTDLLKNGEILCSALGNYKPGIEQEDFARYGYEKAYVKITDPYVNTTSILGTLQAVSITSGNPERALMFIDEVNSDPELYNLLVYGLEGKHYNMISENRIEVIADSGYSTNVPWMIGNTFNGYLKGDTDASVYEQTKKLNEESAVSRILGFSFNPEPVKAEISQCQIITDKYLSGFQFGLYDDVDVALEQMNRELREAGMDRIISEKQAQLDAWTAVNR